MAGRSWTGSTAACIEDGCSRSYFAVIVRHRRAAPEARGRQLAADPSDLRRLGLQPVEGDHAANVAGCNMVWTLPTGEGRVHESAPIVNNGVMFVSTPNNQVIALDAKTGTVLWRTAGRGRQARSCCTRRIAASRSTATRCIFAAGEAVLVALDARTGREVWAKSVADNKSAYYMTLAPLVADGKVMIGASGGEFGVRGFVAAFDPDTGKELWRTYMVPARASRAARPGRRATSGRPAARRYG